MAKDEVKVYSSEELKSRIRGKYPSPAWVVLNELRDCPHIFALQICDCGKQFVGVLGKKYKCDEMVEGK